MVTDTDNYLGSDYEMRNVNELEKDKPEKPPKTFKERFKEMGVPGLFYAACRTLDSVMTATNVEQNGLGVEGNPITAQIMETWGVNAGMIGSGVAEAAVVLPLAYKKDEIIGVNSKHVLYILGTAHLLGAASHLPYLLKDYF